MVKVIIAITTYNLDKYIEKALDSVLAQKTNFQFKIVVADDCSTDNTIEILKKYETMYPDIIEVLLSDHNLGSLRNSNRIFDGLQCEYFSFLDGDDYWIGEDRLQKQVDYLDSHPDYMLCGGNTQYLKEDVLSGYVINDNYLGKTYSFDSMLKGEVPFVHTSALLIRNSIFNNGIPECFKTAENTYENCALRGEDFRRILHLEKGYMYVMRDVVSVYRIHNHGLWQSSSHANKVIERAISFNFYKKYFESYDTVYFKKMADNTYRSMMETLLIERDMLNSYELDAKETFLLTSLLRDRVSIDCAHTQQSKIKKVLQKIILRLLF